MTAPQGRSRLLTTLAMAAALGLLAWSASGCSAINAPSTSGESSSTGGGYPGAPAADRGLSVVPYGTSTQHSVVAGTEDALGKRSGGTGPNTANLPASEKLIIRDKTMRIEVAKVNDAIAKIRAMAGRDGADITQMQVATSVDTPIYRPEMEGQAPSDTNAGPLQAYVTIRVPAGRYQAFIDAAAKLGRVLFQSENTEDVTQQHVDLKARLDNLRVEERRLRQFFAKAKNVTEMLKIEAELSRVRGEIESMAAQVAYLERQAAMATVTIELSEPKALVRPTGTDWGVGKAFTDSVRAFVNTMNVLIILVGPVLALLVFVGLPVAIVVWLLAKRMRKRGSRGTDSADESLDERA